MRLEAPSAHGFVWHCELAQEVKRAIWVDDETHEVGVLTDRVDVARLRVEERVERFRKVLIVNASNPVLVFVNPVEGDDLAEMQRDVEHLRRVYEALEGAAWRALT